MNRNLEAELIIQLNNATGVSGTEQVIKSNLRKKRQKLSNGSPKSGPKSGCSAAAPLTGNFRRLLQLDL